MARTWNLNGGAGSSHWAVVAVHGRGGGGVTHTPNATKFYTAVSMKCMLCVAQIVEHFKRTLAVLAISTPTHSTKLLVLLQHI